MTEPAYQERCDEHHEAERVPCERCGDFVCVDCVPLDAPPRCAPCRARHGIEDVPWEVSDTPMPKRWWDTTRAFVTRPTRTLERTKPQRARPALSYLLNTSAVVILAAWMLVFVGELALSGFGAIQPAALAVPLLLGGALGLTTVVRIAVFHGMARVLGGSGTWSASVACVAYLQGIVVVVVPLSLSRWIPGLAPLVFSLGLLALEAFLAVNLTTAARLYHGLRTGRAAAAAWAPFVAVLATLVLGCGFLGAVLDGVAYRS